MKKLEVIYSDGDHRWAIIARDPEKPGYVIDTNEYLVTKADQALLTDPGGLAIFPMVFAALAEVMDPRQLQVLFASHQDPDIISSLSLWLDFKPEMKCYLSWLWESFVPHFGGTDDTFISIPDDGMRFMLGDLALEAVPAHYLHSSGNFHLYDGTAKIMFSGDVGAALLPEDECPIFVKNFDRHIRYAQGFHQRWMGSNQAKNNWCDRVAELDIDMLCPQHGAIYQGEDVARFIEWFRSLDVGLGVASTRR